MSFRDLALSWVGSGRSLGALMSWWLTRRYRQYSNLNEWEQEFLNKSGNYGALKLATIVLGALIVAVGSVNFHDLYRDYYAPGQVLPVTRDILNDSTNADQKIRGIKWLSDNRQKIEIPGVQLSGPGRKDLIRLIAPAGTFKNSTLNEVHLEGANLAGASFSNSVLANTSFNGAYLYRAAFDGAELCKQVDFTGADVLAASFKRARFAANDIPIFTNTPWWQATGWGFEEIDHLSSAYPKDKIRDSERYKADSERVLVKVNNEKDPLLLAMALNEQAWTLATYGVVDEVAKSAVMNARELLKTSAHIDNKDISSLQVQLDDTFAYILMQETDALMQENDSPKRQESLAKVVDTLRGSAKALRNGQLFHYAIALHGSQNEVEANEKLREALIEQQYEPSHELYLLNHYMTGEFKQKVMDMTGRTGRRLLPNKARCENAEQTAARSR
jgi:hypothetical protein